MPRPKTPRGRPLKYPMPEPLDVDMDTLAEVVLKAKVKEVWRYEQESGRSKQSAKHGELRLLVHKRVIPLFFLCLLSISILACGPLPTVAPAESTATPKTVSASPVGTFSPEQLSVGRAVYEAYTGVAPRSNEHAATSVAKSPTGDIEGQPTQTPAEISYGRYKGWDFPRYVDVKRCTDKLDVPLDDMLIILQHNYDFYTLMRSIASEPGFRDCFGLTATPVIDLPDYQEIRDELNSVRLFGDWQGEDREENCAILSEMLERYSKLVEGYPLWSTNDARIKIAHEGIADLRLIMRNALGTVWCQ